MVNTIYKLKNGSIQEKKATLFINYFKKNKKTKIGYAKLDLSKFINQRVGAALKLPLMKTPKSTKAFIRFNICSQLLQANVEDDNESVMSGASSLGDFDDLGLDEEHKEQQSLPKIGTFQPPTISTRHAGQKSLDMLRSGPLRAQAHHIHQASEVAGIQHSQEKDQEDISSSRKHIPMKLSKQNIKLLKSTKGKLPPSGFRHSSKVVLTRQNNRVIEEERETTNQIDLTPQKDKKDLSIEESPEERYKTHRSSMRVKAPLQKRKSKLEEYYNKVEEQETTTQKSKDGPEYQDSLDILSAKETLSKKQPVLEQDFTFEKSKVDLNGKDEKLKSQCAYYKEGYERLLKENKELNDKMSLQDSLEQSNPSEALKTQIQMLEREMADSQKKHIIEVDRLKSNYERRERQLKEEITLLTESKKTLQERQKRMESDILREEMGYSFQESSLKLKTEDSVSQYLDQISKLKIELDQRNHKVSSLELQQTVSNSEECLKLKEDLRNANQKISQKDKQIQELRSMKSENESLRQALTKRKEQLRAASSSKDSELGQLIVQNQFLKAQVVELEVSLQKYERVERHESTDSLKEILKNVQKENTGLQDSLVSLQQEVTTLQLSAAETKVRFALQQTLLAASEAQNDSLISRMKQKSEENARLHESVSDLEMELIKSRQALGEAMNQINDFELGHQKLKKKK